MGFRMVGNLTDKVLTENTYLYEINVTIKCMSARFLNQDRGGGGGPSCLDKFKLKKHCQLVIWSLGKDEKRSGWFPRFLLTFDLICMPYHSNSSGKAYMANIESKVRENLRCVRIFFEVCWGNYQCCTLRNLKWTRRWTACWVRK